MDDGNAIESTRSPKTRSSADPRPRNWQGSRVSSVTLGDGRVVELGGDLSSWAFSNQLVIDTVNGDPRRLEKIKPLGTGENETVGIASGLGIYHGGGEWLLNTAPHSEYSSSLRAIATRFYFWWRYNVDYNRLNKAVKSAVRSFDLIYDLLNDTRHEVTYFQSPMDMWDAVGLRGLVGVSFHDFLDGLGLHRDTSLEPKGNSDVAGSRGRGWFDWRSLVGAGCMRAELVSAMAIHTYNQDLSQMNGLVGLSSYVPAGGELFSIQGGNHRLMESSLYQARDIYSSSSCESMSRIQRHQAKVTTVVAKEDSMELFAERQSLGKYDVVILAAPLQQCHIRFLIENPMGIDEAVLHDMPLGGIYDNLESDEAPSLSHVANNEHGRRSFVHPLPKSATVPYTTVVATLVSNATLNATHFGLPPDGPWPRSILVSERGKLLEGLSTLKILSFNRGLMKTFSSERLADHKREILFGPHHKLEYVQVWGDEEHGKYGGATPDFDGGRNSESLPYLLYDGSRHWGKVGSGDGPALYYVNAIESAVSAIEISAIGAKSTAKLVARRLGLIELVGDDIVRDEL